MLVRFGLLLVLSCAILYSSSLYITSDLLHLFYFGLGYLFISSITQYCLVNGIWKNDDVINVVDKMYNKDSNSEIIEEE